jgi:hypothetical protein
VPALSLSTIEQVCKVLADTVTGPQVPNLNAALKVGEPPGDDQNAKWKRLFNTVTGTEDRQHAYGAMTRGTHGNTAYVFTTSPKIADPHPARGPHRSWTARTGGPSNGPASPCQMPGRTLTARRSACSPRCWNATASNCQPLRNSPAACPTPTTWRSCTPSGPPKPRPPASSVTAPCSTLEVDQHHLAVRTLDQVALVGVAVDGAR